MPRTAQPERRVPPGQPVQNNEKGLEKALFLLGENVYNEEKGRSSEE